MARPLRIELAGGLYHVMSRGNERRDIVRDDADRQRRLDWLQRTVATYGWRLHAFALLTNHEHLFVETPEPNLSAGMHLLNSSYTGYFNLRHRRAGHLFQGRFKAQLIEEEGHYLEISRYIHLNPVRAKLVTRPEAWPWSSYPGYHRVSAVRGWVTYARVLREFGNSERESRRAYRRFVQAGMAPSPVCPWAKALGGLIVGGDSFAQRIRRLLNDRPASEDLPQLACLRARPSLEAIVRTVAHHLGAATAGWSVGSRCNDLSRAAVAYLARRQYGYSAAEVASVLGYRGPSSVSTAVSRIESGNDTLRKLLATIVRELAND